MHEQIRRMLSAYIDAELTQADNQRVRIHLEDCEECRLACEQLEKLRRVTSEMKFMDPPEDKMSEIEDRVSVQAPRIAGWGLFLIGAAVWFVYAVYLFVSEPDQPIWQKLMVGAIVIGLVLILVSVLRQRLLELPHDRYRRVKK
jgi:predicted anti-sigma-YlaC factor YlaD